VAIGTILSITTLLSVIITLGMHLAAHVLLSSAKGLPRGKMPISVLRPLKGPIDALEENLESLCQQDYPHYEIIVAAADANDSALRIARRVRDKYPKIPFRLLSGQWATGLNPKVRLLRRMLGHTRYDGILISDDNVRVRFDYLSVMAGALAQPNTGLVSNLVVGVGGRSVGAICENLQLNTFILMSVAASYLFGHPVVIGKSMLLRRDALTNAGGFAAVADVLAEDHLLGRAVRTAGYRVRTLGYPVYTVNVDWQLRRTVDRHLRWCKIRASVAPWLFPFELLAQPVLFLVLTLGAVWLIDPSPSSGFVQNAVFGVLVTTLSEIGLIRHAQGRYYQRWDALLLPLRSVLALVAHLGSGLVSVVHWRNEACRIGKDSRLIPLHTSCDCKGPPTLRRAA
jgi:ceramide glucosyltransferase